MSFELPPFVFLILGGLILPLVPRKLRAATFLLFPALALAAVWTHPDGAVVSAEFFKYELTLMRVDALSRVFGIVLALITLIGGIYSYHLEDTGQRVAALLYSGGALGVAFAGDFLTLLVCWEVMAVASTYLIWARRSQEALRAGMRYLLLAYIPWRDWLRPISTWGAFLVLVLTATFSIASTVYHVHASWYRNRFHE